MRRGLGFLIQASGVLLAVIGVVTAIQMQGNAPAWQVIVFGILAMAIGLGVFVAGGRVRR